jgi:hypothetical protein
MALFNAGIIVQEAVAPAPAVYRATDAAPVRPAVTQEASAPLTAGEMGVKPFSTTPYNASFLMTFKTLW